MRKTPVEKKYRRAVVWMRRALRVRDNAALWHAVQDAVEVIPVVCLRGGNAYQAETPRRRYLRAAIADLEGNLRRLGSGLAVRVGDPLREIPASAVEFEADAVYAVNVYDPATQRRDGKIARALQQEGRQLHLVKDCVLFEGKEIVAASGEPYRVYTPYRNALLGSAQEIPRPLPIPVHLATPPLRGKTVPLDRIRGFERTVEEGGESAALRRLRRFLAGPVADYARERDLPGRDGTSRLSAPLSHGAISVRTLYWHTVAAKEHAGERARKSIDLFISELIWREFYYQILANYPHVVGGPFREEFASLRWRHSGRDFEAWTSGETGYPIVDAAMRQLAGEGWMHNRARMIVASFLTKDLHLNWQEGERHFAEVLSDADIASNNGGWQWTAGTGTDASPWFRIFNPVLQGKKFDPDGSYVRAYVPELRRVPARFIHTPWEMSADDQRSARCVVGRNYPSPIVDHAVERGVTLELYRHRRGVATKKPV
jgi:deoxyribodipyrimidine photo-lyase